VPSEPRLSREQRRRQLLDAAIGAIREFGSGVSMEQLAAAGGVTKPILYRHFGDRDGLVATIGGEFAGQVAADINASLGAEADGRQLLEQTIDSFVSFIERDPDLYRFLVQNVSRRDGSGQSVAGLIESISLGVADVMAARLDAAGRDTSPAAPWAFGIVGMVHQSTDWWLENRTMTREELVSHLCDLLWNGLRARDPDED
jgi:AcrR family transcriptional regulator